MTTLAARHASGKLLAKQGETEELRTRHGKRLDEHHHRIGKLEGK